VTDTLITQINQVIQEIHDIKGPIDFSSINKTTVAELPKTKDPTARKEHNRYPKPVLNYHWLSLAGRHLGKRKVEMRPEGVKGGLICSGDATKDGRARVASVGDSLSCSQANNYLREQRDAPKSQRQ
jgi:hypothetical protein